MFDTDKQILKELNPIFAGLLRQLLTYAEERVLPFGIFSGLRTWEEQAKLYAKGRDEAGNIVDPKQVVTNAKPGSSWHNYGLAADIVLDIDNRPGLQPSWKEFVDANQDGANDWLTLGIKGQEFGLEWGGVCFKKQNGFIDVPHWQYRKGILSIKIAQDLYKQGGLELVWQKVI